MKFDVHLSYVASFTVAVEAATEDEASDKALTEFSPYADDSLADVEFSDQPLTIDVQEEE